MSVAPKLPKEVLSLPETTLPCPACGVRPRRAVRFCTHCGNAISRPLRNSHREVPVCLPSFMLSGPEESNAIRNGFLIFSLALPLVGVLFFLNNPQAASQSPPLAGETVMTSPIGEEITTGVSTGRPGRKIVSGNPRSRTLADADIEDAGRTEDISPGGLPVPTIPDTPRPVPPYRTIPAGSQIPISVPVKSRPIPTPALPGPDLREEKRTEFEPRP